MTDFENALEIRNLTKNYDGFSVDNISFDVPKGSIMGFIGQNGAGKTTTIKLILNIITRDKGTINVFGLDNIKNEQEIKNYISAVFDDIPFHDDLTAKHIGIILSDIFPEWNTATYTNYLDRFSLPRNKHIGKRCNQGCNRGWYVLYSFVLLYR